MAKNRKSLLENKNKQYAVFYDIAIRHKKKDNGSSPVIPYQNTFSNANFNVADTNRIIKMHEKKKKEKKMHVAKQLKL